MTDAAASCLSWFPGVVCGLLCISTLKGFSGKRRRHRKSFLKLGGGGLLNTVCVMSVRWPGLRQQDPDVGTYSLFVDDTVCACSAHSVPHFSEASVWGLIAIQALKIRICVTGAPSQPVPLFSLLSSLFSLLFFCWLLSGVVLFLAESWLIWLCTSTCFLGAACGARHHQMDSTSYVLRSTSDWASGTASTDKVCIQLQLGHNLKGVGEWRTALRPQL